MKIAITGATGFLGKYLVPYLEHLSYDIVVLARPEERADLLFFDQVKVFETDYSTGSLFEGINNVDCVIHLAAQTMKRDSDPFRVSTFLPVNIGITENILVAAKDRGINQIVQMSSNSVYSSSNQLPFHEFQNPVPATIYGVSKLYSEKLGEYFASKAGMNIASLRLARLYGYGERDSVVFTKFMKLAIASRNLQILGEGQTRIEYLYVKDAVRAIERALNESINGIFNVGSGRYWTVLDIAKMVNEKCDNSGNLMVDSSKPERGYDILMDSSKFFEATGWQPAWQMEEAVAEMTEKYQSDAEMGKDR